MNKEMNDEMKAGVTLRVENVGVFGEYVIYKVQADKEMVFWIGKGARVTMKTTEDTYQSRIYREYCVSVQKDVIIGLLRDMAK